MHRLSEFGLGGCSNKRSKYQFLTYVKCKPPNLIKFSKFSLVNLYDYSNPLKEKKYLEKKVRQPSNYRKIKQIKNKIHVWCLELFSGSSIHNGMAKRRKSTKSDFIKAWFNNFFWWLIISTSHLELTGIWASIQTTIPTGENVMQVNSCQIINSL